MTSPERRPDPSTPAARPAPGPLRVIGGQSWDQHPGVRSGRRLGPGEHAAYVFCRVAGSWTYLITVTVTLVAGAAAALPHGGPGVLARLGACLAALALVEVSLVLMAARRAERIAVELALYDLDQARRASAIAEDLRGEMQRLHAELARIAAYTEKVGHPARHS